MTNVTPDQKSTGESDAFLSRPAGGNLLGNARKAIGWIRRLKVTPKGNFWSPVYIRHNQRRQEHLASLGLPIEGRDVLEVGAGIGDHTTFFRDRGCKVTITDGRPKNIRLLRERYPDATVKLLDLDRPDPGFGDVAEIVYCYGTLYHLQRPEVALAFLADHCRGILLLETCVSFGTNEEVNLVPELADVPSQAVSGQGCRPTRPWVFNQLKKHFAHVYMPVTQPWHDEFPVDWSGTNDINKLIRAVFIASVKPLDNPLLKEEIPMTQVRH